jgi:small-conductance mechanosensitive channel
MEEVVQFASRSYGLMFVLLLFSRGMDFFSTWVATPNMVLEGNPIAKKLGWKWGIPLNVVLCFAFAFWPLPAIVISTTSVLVAARNFQSAWLMRSLGEQSYRDWHVQRVQETSATLYLFCLLAQTTLTTGVGVAVIWFSDLRLVPLAIGMGIVGYAVAVAFYTLLGIWRLRRSEIKAARLARRQASIQLAPALPAKSAERFFFQACAAEEVRPQGK